jgi:prepilin-type processing-associated H-X9-DG protein
VASVEIRPACNGYTYALNSYLGGRMQYTAGNAPLPKAGLLSSTIYWFGDGPAALSTTAGDLGFDFSATLRLDAPTNTPTTNWPWCWPTPSVTKGWNFAGHPNGAANFVFGDGHCESIAPSQFMTLCPYTPSTSNPYSATLRQFNGYPFTN